MSKSSVDRILERLADEAKQKEEEEYQAALSNLKVGDLIDLCGESIISPVAFTEQASYDKCRLREPGAKHIVDAEGIGENYYSMFPAENIYTGMILEKASNVRCTCFFMYPQHTFDGDFVALLNERPFYIRISRANYKFDSERGILVSRAIED